MAKGMKQCRKASQCERPLRGMWSQGMIKAESKRIKRLCTNLKPTWVLQNQPPFCVYCFCIYDYIYIYIYIHTCVCIMYIYIYVYLHICMYMICIYVEKMGLYFLDKSNLLPLGNQTWIAGKLFENGGLDEKIIEPSRRLSSWPCDTGGYQIWEHQWTYHLIFCSNHVQVE